MRARVAGLVAALVIAGCGADAGNAQVMDPADETGEVHVGANPIDDRSGLRPNAGTHSAAAGPPECPIGDMGYGPITWPAGTGGLRWMIGETQVANVQSSQEKPVEVCGVGGELAWLVSLTCPDGSTPYPNEQVAHLSRIGNTGAGGRCGTIIDLYAVPCPDKQYEVYMDMYHCEQGESF